MNVYDDARLDGVLRDFLHDRADETAAMSTASNMAAAIGWRVGQRRRNPITFGRLVLVAVLLAVALATVTIALVGQRSPDLRGKVSPTIATTCEGASCTPPGRFAGLPYHLDLPDAWIGGGPVSYAANVAWYRARHPGVAQDVPGVHPFFQGPGQIFVAYNTDVPGLRLYINGPSTVPPDTEVEEEIAVWEADFTDTGIVDRVTLPAGEARRAREGPAASDGSMAISYLVVVGRDMYVLKFRYEPADDPADEVAALASSFTVP